MWGDALLFPLLFFTQISLNSLKTLCLSLQFQTDDNIRRNINNSPISLRKKTTLIIKKKRESVLRSRHSHVPGLCKAKEARWNISCFGGSRSPALVPLFQIRSYKTLHRDWSGTEAGLKWVGSLKQRGKSLAVREEKTDCLTHSRLFLLHSQLSLPAALHPKEHGNIF